MVMPWLLLAENTKNNPDHRRKLFNPSRKKCYTLRIPQISGARCWGSSYGWVVMCDLNLNLYLFNPLTHVQISLPPQSTMPCQVKGGEEEVEDDNEWYWSLFIVRVIVLRMVDDDLLVMAIHNPEEKALSFARPGDQAWTYVPTPTNNHGVLDVMSWGGKIIIVYCDNSLGCWDISSGARKLEPTPYLGAPHGLLDNSRNHFYALCLVESFGDLLMVLRHKTEVSDENNPTDENKETPYITLSFEVFRFNVQHEVWERVKDLGDVALFVGDNCSMSVVASDITNCRSNCIYFTDDEFVYWDWPINFGGHDMGVFDLGNKSIETFYQGDDMHSKFCTPLWFMPKLLCMG